MRNTFLASTSVRRNAGYESLSPLEGQPLPQGLADLLGCLLIANVFPQTAMIVELEPTAALRADGGWLFGRAT